MKERIYKKRMFNDAQNIISSFTSNIEDKKSDYLKRENSNFVYSLPLLRKNISNHAEEEFLMNQIFSPELVQAYEEGYLYIHDKQLSSYCQSVGCYDIACKGIPTLAKNMMASQPTRRISKLLRHFSNTVVLMSQQVSGAVMLSQMTTILASYLHNHVENGDIVLETYLPTLQEDIQSLIWELNMPLRSGSESAFTNCTLEFGRPSAEIAHRDVVIGGEYKDYTYADIPGEYFDIINRIIIDCMAKGSGTGIPFTFPLITIPIDDDFHFENETFLYLLDRMYEWNGCYFENFTTKAFTNEYYTKLNNKIKPRDPEVSRSLCCRLQISLDLLSQVGGGIFGSSSSNTGAVQVLNLNMNRMLIEFGHDEALLKAKIKYYFDLMQDGHQAKRQWIENNKDLYPTFFAFNEDLKNYFNVFAITGMHEGLINIGYKEGMKDLEGKKYAHQLVQYIHTIIDEYIVRDSVACGLEYAPSENAGIKLARNDVKWAQAHDREIFVQGTGEDIYLTSGCMLPFSDDDFLSQVENAAEFQAYATSGSILHNFLQEKVEPAILTKYIQNLFKKPISYITLSPTLTSCLNCGQKFVATDATDIGSCPCCGSDDIASFSRVIGYTKMISRKGVKVNEQGYYEGQFNFWSKARRHDWAKRHRVKSTDMNEVAVQDEISK